MTYDELGSTTASVGLLQDEVRRRLYLYVRSAHRAVSRDEAAQAVGISRKLAAFHLDKLLGQALLRAHYARPPGRSGPGAGRSSKLYEVSDAEIQISIPERKYDFAGDMLVEAMESRSQQESPRDAARRVAHERGVTLGQEIKREHGLRPPGPERTLAIAREVLSRYGFEPYLDSGDQIALRNCPFHALSQRSPDLICGMNQAFIDGILRGLGNRSVEARLDPQPGRCCVVLEKPRKES